MYGGKAQTDTAPPQLKGFLLMSRYPSKAEMIEVVKHTVATDYNNLGTPKTLKAFNITGLIRDLKPIGDHRYGWTFQVCDADGFNRAVLNNLRPRWRAGVPTQAEQRAINAHPGNTLDTTRATLQGSGVCSCCGTDFSDPSDITPPRGPLGPLPTLP